MALSIRDFQRQLIEARDLELIRLRVLNRSLRKQLVGESSLVRLSPEVEDLLARWTDSLP